jgi:hypothetical protein
MHAFVALAPSPWGGLCTRMCYCQVEHVPKFYGVQIGICLWIRLHAEWTTVYPQYLHVTVMIIDKSRDHIQLPFESSEVQGLKDKSSNSQGYIGAVITTGGETLSLALASQGIASSLVVVVGGSQTLTKGEVITQAVRQSPLLLRPKRPSSSQLLY